MTSMKNFLGWHDLKTQLIGKSIVAGNADTGLIVMSDGTILDLSLRSFRSALARRPLVLPYGVPSEACKIWEMMVTTRSPERKDLYVTELEIVVRSPDSGFTVKYVLLKMWTEATQMPGVSKFLLANHITRVSGEQLVREVEEEQGVAFR